MSEIPQEVADAVAGTYATWRPYAAATRVEEAPDVLGPLFAERLAAVEALSARIEAARLAPIFPTEEA